MATAKFKVPTDKQIWAEVDEQLANFPESFKVINRVPDRQDLFDQKKAWYLDEPKRQATADAALERANKAKAMQVDADAAYLALRKAQGKPIITVKKFKAQFPQIKVAEIKTYSQQKLHEAYEWSGFIADAKAIQGRHIRLQAVTKAQTYQCLTKTYGLYRRIVKSEAADIAFDEIRAMLWNDYKIKTHYDIPRSSLLLKLVFEGALEKTIHLYTRSFQLADGYDVEEADFTDFIKQIGGMEKIRKAYATVKGADAGTWRPAYELDAEYSASRNELLRAEPFRVVQLEGGQGAILHNDIFGQFCLVVAHIDPMNQLELYGQLPANYAIANDIIQRLTNKHRKAGTPSWLNHKAQSSAYSAKEKRDKILARGEKQAAKEKTAAAAAKKQEAAEKRFAKQRAAQTAAKPVKAKPAAKPKASVKKK